MGVEEPPGMGVLVPVRVVVQMKIVAGPARVRDEPPIDRVELMVARDRQRRGEALRGAASEAREISRAAGDPFGTGCVRTGVATTQERGSSPIDRGGSASLNTIRFEISGSAAVNC
jgi:hypothetical protein